MPTLRDDLIEIGARALCKKRGYDPDRPLPATVPQPFRRCAVGEAMWKEHIDDASLVLDAVFDHRKQEVGSSESK